MQDVLHVASPFNVSPLDLPLSSRAIPDVGPGVRALGLGAPGCAVRWAGLGLDGRIPAEFPF